MKAYAIPTKINKMMNSEKNRYKNVARKERPRNIPMVIRIYFT